MALHSPYTNKKGYVLEYHPEHPRSDSSGYVLAHIVAYEKYTGTTIPDGYVIHHINGTRNDNSPQNLVMMTRKEHTILHHTGQKRSKETKQKLSTWARDRLSDPSRHPMFIPLDIEAIKKDRTDGMKVKDICKKYGISKYTYYKRLTGYRRKK